MSQSQRAILEKPMTTSSLLSAEFVLTGETAFHDLAKIWPDMREAEYIAFKGNIARNGLVDPIILFNGMVLDGRHRCKACIETDTPRRAQTFLGTLEQALDFVESKNERRNLDESQRAMVAAQLVKKRGVKRENSSIELFLSQDAAAKQFNVSRESVKRAVKVERSGIPALKEAVRSGEVKVSRAAVIAQASPKKQATIIRNDRERLSSLALNVKVQSKLKNAKTTTDLCFLHNPTLECSQENFIASMEMLTESLKDRKGGFGATARRYLQSMLSEIDEMEVYEEVLDLEQRVMLVIGQTSHKATEIARLAGLGRQELDAILDQLKEWNLAEPIPQGGKHPEARGGVNELWRLTEKGLKKIEGAEGGIASVDADECESCGRDIPSAVSITSEDGKVFCSQPCLQRYEW